MTRQVVFKVALIAILAICCVQFYFFISTVGLAIPSLLLSVGWFVALCIALATGGPSALWLLVTIPLGLPILTYLVWTVVAMTLSPP